MKATSRLIKTAGTALLPLYLTRENIKTYQCPEEDAYDFVIALKGRFIRIELKSVNGDSENPAAGKVTSKQHKASDYVIVYVLDGDKNRFFTIPTNRTPRNNVIKFSKRKDGSIGGKWTKYEGFDYLKKEVKNRDL